MQVKVYKFGGASLRDKSKIMLAVSACVSEVKSGTKIVCVVSAMGSTTDQLFSLIQNLDPETTVDKSMEILGMGEMISARILNYMLKIAEVRSMILEPGAKKWPLILKTDGSLNRSQTKSRIERNFPGFFRDFDCIVVPGFIAVKKSGEWGTLGRGGSDTTAFVLGKYLKAVEVVMVKDVDGIYAVDPSIFPKAKHLRLISADSLSTMSSFGANVIHSDALSYKKKGQKAKIVHHSFGNLEYEGTVIDGKVGRKLFLLDQELSLISICKKDITGNRKLIKKLTCMVLETSNVFGTTLGIEYLGFYVPDEKSQKVIKKLANVSKKFGLSIIETKNVALLIMKRESPVNLPGMINYLLSPLAKKHLNVVEVISIGREILLFIRWKDRIKAMQALRRGGKRKV